MGACVSYHSEERTTEKAIASGKGCGRNGIASESFRRPSSIIVIDMAAGGIKEYKQPIPARLVVSENPACYLCNAESMCIGTCIPRVPDEEDLLPGRIYFLVPLTHSHYPLSLSLLCDLAVKASSALTNTCSSNTQRPSL